MKKTIFKWVILVALFSYMLCISVWAARQDALRKCNGIEVEIAESNGPMPLTKSGITEELLKYKPNLIGSDINKINTEDLERHLMSLAYFETVECVTTTTGKLRVMVTAMVPVGRVFDGNASYYINKDGKRINAIPSFHCDVPLITGNFGKGNEAGDILPVIRFIESNPTLSHLVTMIKVDDPDNIILSTIWKGHVVNIGDTANLPRKFRYLDAAYRHILPKQGWETYDTLYVKFRGQIVASRRDKSALTHSKPLDDESDLEEEALQLTDLSNGNTTENQNTDNPKTNP